MNKSKFTQNVNKDKFFNDLPEVKPEKSKWLSKHTNYLSCSLGQIIPVYYSEALPGERRKITMAMTSHTTTPVAPFFNANYVEFRAFFVPHRLSADLLNGYKDRKSPWVKVFGEDNKSTNSTVIVPLENQKLPDFPEVFLNDVSGAYSEVSSNDNIFDFLDISGESASDFSNYNFLNLAAYELIYQRHYRNENFESPTESALYRFLYDAYNRNSESYISGFSFEIANREKDYFTGAKPFTQKGDPVRVSVGDIAPVIASGSSHSMGSNGVLLSASNGVTNIPSAIASDSNGKLAIVAQTESGVPTSAIISNSNWSSNLVADLKSAQGISIEELRLLIKTQELLEKDAMYGTRYAESLNAHFGTCPLDLTLQDPQELYRTTITSNMQAIFQTSTTQGEQSILGTIGANSTTQTDPFVILPETEFKEHGLIMICAVHKLQNVYDSRYFKPKFNFKKERFDFYTPELNDLGFQPIEANEALALRTRGFNEAFAEYRYSFNQVHGRLAQEFPYWAPAIGNEYSSIASMYKEDPIILDKALSVLSDSAPQFYDAFGFEEENTKPMSLHSIPGMDGVI